jgi:hypothetical protein
VQKPKTKYPNAAESMKSAEIKKTRRAIELNSSLDKIEGDSALSKIALG